MDILRTAESASPVMKICKRLLNLRDVFAPLFQALNLRGFLDPTIHAGLNMLFGLRRRVLILRTVSVTLSMIPCALLMERINLTVLLSVMDLLPEG